MRIIARLVAVGAIYLGAGWVAGQNGFDPSLTLNCWSPQHSGDDLERFLISAVRPNQTRDLIVLLPESQTLVSEACSQTSNHILCQYQQTAVHIFTARPRQSENWINGRIEGYRVEGYRTSIGSPNQKVECYQAAR